MDQARVEPCPGESVALHLAYTQDIAKIARDAIPFEAGQGASFHLRQRADNRYLFLEVEGPPQAALIDLAKGWRETLLVRSEQVRRQELSGYPPKRKACLESRLIRLSPAPEADCEGMSTIAPPWWSIFAALGALGVALTRERSHHE
jgi:hypothetical protein